MHKIPTREPTLELIPQLATKPTKHKKSKIKSQKEFMNEIIANEKDIKKELFRVSEPIVFSKRCN